MAQYIDKDAVLAEIEKTKGKIDDQDAYSYGWQNSLRSLEIAITTLEVKEVDLKNEIDEYISNNFFGSQTLGFFANRTEEEPNYVDIALCARYFFELGLKAQKGETV